ncbi:MAG TPA: hypothetical protein DEO36_03420 [Flavobacteriaceae bacterium]|jgi:uncharacterized protein (TIGR02231 family)|nr:hypothetical protein [Flavobacteriaceae bacterium]
MKYLTLLLIISFNTIISQTTTNIVSHNINEVTIYLNNAEITRTGNVDIPEGKSDILFKGISSRILDQGLKLEMSNNVRIYTIEIEPDNDSLSRNKEYQKITNTIRTLKESFSLNEIKLQTLKKEIQYLEANMKIGGANRVTYAQIDQGAQYFSKKINLLQQKIHDEKIKKELLELKIEKEESLQEKLIHTLKKTNASIRVTIISSIATNSKINLRYLVSNALWKPIYSIRANEGQSSITIQYQAQLYNDTGNDWTNKPITLAILDSSADINKPEMKIWTLEGDEYEYSNTRRYNNKKSKNQKEEKEQEYNTLQVDNLSTRFKINDLHNIPSDATPHLIDVIEYNKDVTYYTLSIPKVKNGAFKVASIRDWDNLGLLDGMANLYYNDSYQGTSKIKTQQINHTLDIALGKDNTFNISRKKVSSLSRRNLIGFNIKEVITYEILVKNNKNTKSSLQIKDQIPISTSKNVEATPLELSSGILDPINGQVVWNISLKPNEVKKLILKVSIKYPKSKRGLINFSRKNIKSPRFF